MNLCSSLLTCSFLLVVIFCLSSVQCKRLQHGVHRSRTRRGASKDSSTVEVYSAQEIKLSGGTTYNEGRVEVYSSKRWDLVCASRWGPREADVACRQLGFSRGASVVQHGKGSTGKYQDHTDFWLDNTECQGNETRIQDCSHSTTAYCALSKAVRVVCLPNKGCADGWIAGPRSRACYKLERSAHLAMAEDKCRAMGAHLVMIDSQQDSDFISNWLFTKSNETYFLTAGRRMVRWGVSFWKWATTNELIRFDKWFPGFPPHNSQSQPSNHPGQDCVVLARRFLDQSDILRDVNYYFWNDAPCDVRLNFICEKEASEPTPGCYHGSGEAYRGPADRTELGTECVKWTLSTHINPTIYPDKGLGDHNYCRNPDGDSRPWCWVKAQGDSNLRFGYCALSECANETSSSLIDSLKSSTKAPPTIATVAITSPANASPTSPSPTAPLPQCGLRPIHQKITKIAAGILAQYGAFPWQAAIWRYTEETGWGHWCGGAIINDRWILTAAHCIYAIRLQKENLRVITGDADNRIVEGFEQQFEIESIVIPDVYSSVTHDGDIALIKLRPIGAEYIQFNDHVQPACLPADDSTQLYSEERHCLIAGWGQTSAFGGFFEAYKNELRAGIVPILPDSTCRDIYRRQGFTKNMFCAGYLPAGHDDSCQGDSGGGLVCDIDGSYTVLGVISWGIGCSRNRSPGVYAKVGMFKNWIDKTITK